jgi:hypothetical protein
MSDNKLDNLYDTKNYEKRIHLKSSYTYVSKFVDLLNEYLLHGSENIKMGDTHLYNFVLIRGIDTLRHIFLYLLMYTRNINLTYHHCSKAYLYYIEFISQIGEENCSFLQLNSKDAALFVYKKTIYEININVKKTFAQSKQEKQCIDIVKNIIEIYNVLIKLAIYHLGDIELKDNQKIVFIEKQTTKIINKLLINNTFYDEEVCYNLIKFINFIDTKQIDYVKKINIIYTIVKKISIKNKINFESINKKCCDNFCDKKIEQNSPVKFTNWLLCEPNV